MTSYFLTNPFRVLTIAAVFALSLVAASGQGTGGAGGFHTWTGTSSTDFFDTANWNTGFWPNGVANYGPAGGSNTTVERSSQTYTYQYGIQFTNATDTNGNYTLSGTQAYAFYNYGVRTTAMSSGTLNEIINNDITRNGEYGYELGENHDLTLNGTISSATPLVKKGEGTLFLTGANTYTGATTVNAGTLSVSNSSNTPSYTIDSGATLNLSATPSANTTFNGDGTLNVTGSVNLSAIAGTFSMGGGAYIDVKSGGGQIVSNGGNDPWTGNLADVNVDGWLYGAANNFNIDALTGSGLVQMGQGTIVLGVNDGSGTFTGNVTSSYADAHLRKEGSGIQTLSGTVNLGATGTTTVNGGTLLIDGDSSGTGGSVTVADGATLGGSGTIGGTTTIEGIHSPGNSPGIQTFTGGLSYASGSAVNWELIGNTTSGPGVNFDRIMVDGGLSFASSTTLNLDFSTIPGNGGSVDWTDSFWGLHNIREWQIWGVTSGTTTGFENITLNVLPNDSTGSAFNPGTNVPSSANFYLFQSGESIYLRYEALPEPTTFGFLAAILGAITALARPRRRTA